MILPSCHLAVTTSTLLSLIAPFAQKASTEFFQHNDHNSIESWYDLLYTKGQLKLFVHLEGSSRRASIPACSWTLFPGKVR